MACSIPAAEYLGICIIMADYNLGLNTLEVVTRVDRFEEKTGIWYGAGSQDFHRAFGDLMLKTMPYSGPYDLDEALGKTVIGDWVGPILSFDSVSFNDEGEYWEQCPEDADWPPDRRGLTSWTDEFGDLHDRYIRGRLGDRHIIASSLQFDLDLRELFKDGSPCRDDLVRFFSRSRYARMIPRWWATNRL